MLFLAVVFELSGVFILYVLEVGPTNQSTDHSINRSTTTTTTTTTTGTTETTRISIGQTSN